MKGARINLAERPSGYPARSELRRGLLQKATFPVRVRLRDGSSFEIAAREFAVVGVTYLDFGSQAADAPEGIWQRINTIQLQDISGIESLASPSSVSSK